MLRDKLFRAFALVLLAWGALVTALGVSILRARVGGEAQARVRTDMASAWTALGARQDEVRTVLELTAMRHILWTGEWHSPAVTTALAQCRERFGLDFLGVAGADGRVVRRATRPAPGSQADAQDPLLRLALQGNAISCFRVLSAREMAAESAAMAERSAIRLEPTPHARATDRTQAEEGLVMYAAVPIIAGGKVVGALYGGVLLNRNLALVDTIRDKAYRGETHNGEGVGSATVFLGDLRVATTVLGQDGERAIGTRVSQEVAERVLDNGRPWHDRAFVVKDWYITAYDPIRDPDGKVVGMLYVGLLERPFKDMERDMLLRFALLLALGLAAALALSYWLAGRIAAPIHRLVVAAERIRETGQADPVPLAGTCRETEVLVSSFNRMAASLVEREARMKASNQSYMEILGFVAHELKSPVAAIMNYVYLLRERRIGELTEKQAKAVSVIDANTLRIVEMIRHYLNLSRIEKGDLQPIPTRVRVLDEVLHPLLQGLETEVAAHAIRLENGIGQEVAVQADLNMTKEIFENLVHNAVKYNRPRGVVRLEAAAVPGAVEFRVGNEGAGFEPGEVPQAFGKFRRFKQGLHKKGTGLGLFITRSLVEAHGGRIELTSDPGRWTEFRFTLPAADNKDNPVLKEAIPA